MQDNCWVSDITGPRTVRVVLDYLRLWDVVREVQLTDEPDKLRWNWDSGGA